METSRASTRRVAVISSAKALAKGTFSAIMGDLETEEAGMVAFVIEELKGDWERHARAAREGNPRASHAALETLERLEALGVDSTWLRRAKASGPAPFTSWAINNEREERIHCE